MLNKNPKKFIRILIRKEDIKQTHSLWITTPYIKGEYSKQCCLALIKEYKKINKKFSSKFKINIPKNKIIQIWLKNKIFPIILLNYINLNSNKFKIDGISNRDSSSFFNPFKADLKNIDLFYLIGCIVGDGNFSKGTLSIYDGHPNKDYLIHSYNFLLNLKKLFIDLFEVKEETIRIYKHKKQNNYNLQFNNKWLIRYLNYFFNIPYGKKINVNLSPQKFKITDIPLKSKISFSQGLFDTDGSINPSVKNISLVSQNKELLLWCRKLFFYLNIDTKELKEIKNSKELKILLSGFKAFKENIGFRHPRKKMILEKHYSKPLRAIKFIGLKKENLINNYFDIILIKDVRIFPGGWFIKEIKNKLKINGKELAQKINLSQPYINEIENNKKSLSLPFFLDLIKLLYKKEEFYSELLKRNCLFMCGKNGGRSKKAKLPLIWSKEIDEMAKEIKILNRYTCYFKKDSFLKERIKNQFEIKLYENSNYNYVLNYEIINRFFNTFYHYKHHPYLK